MSGGEIVVLGKPGENTGTSCVAGWSPWAADAGACTGFSMIAGTVVCFGCRRTDAGALEQARLARRLGQVAAPRHLPLRLHAPAGIPAPALRRGCATASACR